MRDVAVPLGGLILLLENVRKIPCPVEHPDHRDAVLCFNEKNQIVLEAGHGQFSQALEPGLIDFAEHPLLERTS